MLIRSQLGIGLSALALAVVLIAVACSPDSTQTDLPDATPTLLPTPTLTPEPTETPINNFGSDPFNDGMLARRNGDYARAVAAFTRALNTATRADLASESQFRLGEAHWLKGDHARAIQTLSTYLRTYPNGTRVPEANYILADSYRAIKDYANAIASYRVYRDQSATLVGDVDATIADVMVLMGDGAGAIAQYGRALEDKILSTATRISILIRLAEVHQGRGQPARAAATFDTAFQTATDARTRADLLRRAGEAYAAANQTDLAIQRWKTAFQQFPEHSGAYQSLIFLVNRGIAVDEFQRGLVDYHARAYDAAIAAFQRYLKSDSARAADARFYIASSYARKSAYTQAITEYDIIIRLYNKSDRLADAYLGKASAQGIIGKVDDAVVTYKRFAANYPEDARADDALWRAAQLLDRVKRHADAAVLYAQVQSKYPTREFASEALFLAGLNDYRGKDYKSAMMRWETLVKTYPQSAHYARALFWLGKGAEIRGQNDAAKKYWTQASTAGTNYYTYRAAELLAPKNSNNAARYDLARYAMDNPRDRAEFEKWLMGWAKPGNSALGSLDAAMRDDLRFRRGAELLRLARTGDARREFTSLIASKSDDPRALYALALYLREQDLYSQAIDCANRMARAATSAGAPEAPRWLWMMRYPADYADLVVAESKKNQIDPLLYFALIKQESNFNPWATSSADARGLGQVIPSTGREIAQKLSVKNFALDQLYLPFVSIRFGTWYFAQDLKRFGEPIYALAAYNAGGRRVANWQRTDIDLAVEEIDLSETALYVRIVYANWHQYQEIYK